MEETLGPSTVKRLLTLTRRLRAGPGRAATAAVDLLGRGAYDLLWVTLCPAHFGGHWLWDPTRLFAGELDPAQRDELERALAEIYVGVDEATGRILDALPPGADVMVVSPTGIGVNTSRSDLLAGLVAAVLAGGAAPAASRRGRARSGGCAAPCHRRSATRSRP